MGRSGRPGGIVSLVGKGVGLASEYHEHRKQVKLQREASNQSQSQSQSPDPADSGPSSRSDTAARLSPGEPPAYDDGFESSHDRSQVEYSASSDEKRQSPRSYDDETDSDLDDELEQAWALDEASGRQSPPSYDESVATDDLVRDTLGSHPHHVGPRVQLPMPVVIPQRRPGSRGRGFVRAYAPVLEPCGIDQTTFLSFLKNFQRASQASPWLYAVAVSAGIAGFAPGMIAAIVCTSVQVGAQVGIQVQSRYRLNTFLNQINESLFMPAGLYAMVMKYTPDMDGQSQPGQYRIGTETVDLNTGAEIAKLHQQRNANDNRLASMMSNLHLGSGVTHGEAEMPQIAPLIYPDLDATIQRQTQGEEETFKDKTRDFQKFLANYQDKRAQMQYARDNPDSSLVVPRGQRSFVSKLSDPNHPAFSGGLINLATGGQLAALRNRGSSEGKSSGKRSRRDRRRRRRSDDKYDGDGDGDGDDDVADMSGARAGQLRDSRSGRASNDLSSPMSGNGGRRRAQRRRGGGGPLGMIRNLKKEPVLYLMIVNMPSESELREARREMGMSG